MKADFPFFQNNPELVYMDSAATTQKPKRVIQVMSEWYEKYNSNVDGYYSVSLATTRQIISAREGVASILNVKPDEVIFVPSATYAANLVLQGVVSNMSPGDCLVITEQDHHSVFVTALNVASNSSVEILLWPLLNSGELDMDWLAKQKEKKVKCIALPQVSNVLGILNPVELITIKAHEYWSGSLVVVDASQGIAHTDPSQLSQQCDIFFFSAHKCYGPLGCGVLSGKRTYLDALQPLVTGGKIVTNVDSDTYTLKPLPDRLEPGTPDTPAILGMYEALRYYQSHKNIEKEHNLITKLEQGIVQIPGFRVLSQGLRKYGIVSCVHESISSLDIGMVLAKKNIAVRTGTQCAIPTHRRLTSNEGSIRFSIGLYTDVSDIESAIFALKSALDILQ